MSGSSSPVKGSQVRDNPRMLLHTLMLLRAHRVAVKATWPRCVGSLARVGQMSGGTLA